MHKICGFSDLRWNLFLRRNIFWLGRIIELLRLVNSLKHNDILDNLHIKFILKWSRYSSVRIQLTVKMLGSFAKECQIFVPFIFFTEGNSYPFGHEKRNINVKIMFSITNSTTIYLHRSPLNMNINWGRSDLF